MLVNASREFTSTQLLSKLNKYQKETDIHASMYIEAKKNYSKSIE